MGTWGSSLYSNDTTSDVRDVYLDFLSKQLSNEEAYEKTLEKCKDYIKDQDDEPLFWFALADTQWKVGRLMPEVKEKALTWIQKGGGLEFWAESKNGGAGWKKTLEKLSVKLNTEQPREKRIRKPETIDYNPWNVNDVYAYQFNGKEAEEQGFLGKYMILQKIGEKKLSYMPDMLMRIQVFDYIFNELPTLDSMDGLRILPVDSPTRANIAHDMIPKPDDPPNIMHSCHDPIHMSAYMFIYKKRDYPAKHLTFLGNRPGPANKRTNDRELFWSQIDSSLIDFYQIWHELEYETIEEGIYRYDPDAEGKGK